MIPIDGSLPIGGIQPKEPTKGSSAIEPPKRIEMDESPATRSPNASEVLKNLTSLTTDAGRPLLGEAIKQGLAHQNE